MKTPLQLACFLGMTVLPLTAPAQSQVVFETTSAYHNIRVIDDLGIRTLSFDGSYETQMSLENPLEGHFQYIEYFHLPWLWNTNLSRVLMIGLGGGSVQRAFQHWYPDLELETVEIDPMVRQVAKSFFHIQESPKQRVHIADGRAFLRRSQDQYDLIILDAYRTARYSSYIPYHLVTREFFEIAAGRLTTNGVLAYNVIGTLQGYQADIMGAVYRTLTAVFPQVYMFPARDSQNVVMLATRSRTRLTMFQLSQQAAALAKAKRNLPPNIRTLIGAYRVQSPLSAARSEVLTDDFAPVDGLLTAPRRREAPKAPKK